MASISFSLESSVATVAHLESVLQDEVSTVDGKIMLVFDDVKEDLALWLLTAVTAYHGLIPSPPHPIAPAPINVVAKDDDGLDKELSVRSESPSRIPKAKKADLTIKVNHANGKGE